MRNTLLKLLAFGRDRKILTGILYLINFFLKTTQACGNIGVVICKDKQKFDREDAISKLNKGLKMNLFNTSREWPYKNVEPMVFAETYMEDENGELRDYKFFCFDGKVKALLIATERQNRSEPFLNFFDDNFNHLGIKLGHPVNPNIPIMPVSFDDIKTIAEKLSEGLPHVRVDLYIIRGKVYFGEYTFYSCGGVTPFEPEEWDHIFGSWLKLPNPILDYF